MATRVGALLGLLALLSTTAAMSVASVSPTQLAMVSPAQLRALSSVAHIRTSLASLPSIAALPDTSELRTAAASLVGELDALTCAKPSTLLGLDAAPPRLEALLLQERLAEEAQELAKVQDQQDDARSRQLFELIDKSNDGLIQFDEFRGAAPAIFAPGVLTRYLKQHCAGHCAFCPYLPPSRPSPRTLTVPNYPAKR